MYPQPARGLRAGWPERLNKTVGPGASRVAVRGPRGGENLGTHIRRKVIKMLSKFIKAAIVGLLIAALVHSLPDIKRYIADRKM
jgi:hypothetical protein